MENEIKCYNIASKYLDCILGKQKHNCNNIYKIYMECCLIFSDS